MVQNKTTSIPVTAFCVFGITISIPYVSRLVHRGISCRAFFRKVTVFSYILYYFSISSLLLFVFNCILRKLKKRKEAYGKEYKIRICERQ